MVLFAVTASAQTSPPSVNAIESAFRSRGAEGGSRFVLWPARKSSFTVRDVAGWKVHFRQSKTDSNALMFRFEYSATAEKAGNCHEYRIVQVLPSGPPPPHIKADVTVEYVGAGFVGS